MKITSSHKMFGALFLLLMILEISTLFRTFQAPDCTEPVSGPLRTTVVINCDSAQFMQDSQNPSRILRAETDYQDRPLYALTAWLIEKPIGFFVKQSKTFSNASGKEIEFFYSFYLAFVILHVGILAASLAFLLTALRKMLATTHSRSMRYLMIATLFSLIYLNDVAKAFFWTPHTQLFNIFVVPFSLYSWIRFREKLTLRKEIVWFISVSLLLFFYPLLVVVLTIPLLTQYRRYWTWVISALLPYLVYPKLLTVFGGVYKNTATTKYDQFVWLFDVKSLNQLGERLTALLGTFDSQYVVITLCCISLLIVDFRSFLMKKELLIYLGFLGGYFLFIFGMGAYFYRITTLFLVAVITFLILILTEAGRSKALKVLLLVTLLVNSAQFFFTQGRLY